MGNLVSEIQVSYKPQVDPSKRAVVKNSDQAHAIFRKYWNMETIGYQEESKVIFLNHVFQVIGLLNHSKGTESSSLVSTKQIIAVGLKTNAAGFILAHNHPGGTLWASESDYHSTKQMERVAEICQLKLYDHLIIRKEDGYYSFAEDGILGFGNDYTKYA